jgi:spermidine-citrate ligase
MIGEETLASRQVAERATLQGFLNCYLRETGAAEFLEARRIGGFEALGLRETQRVVRCALRRPGIEVIAPVRYLSPTGRHLFRFPLFYKPEGRPEFSELDLITAANLLAGELEEGRERGSEVEELLLRVVDSCRNVERFVEARREDPEKLYAPRGDFASAEQSLVFGHHLHPTPKSRQDMTENEAEAYSPELGAAFPLHYFRAHRSVVREGSALEESATAGIKAELREDPAVDEVIKSAYCKDDAFSLVPVHPWQARFLLRKPEVRDLVEQGLLEDLGPLGSPYKPTSSIRTVHREDAGFMYKLSLNVRITNSVRANLEKELRRGIKTFRVLESEVGRGLFERFPSFGVVRDPAYITVDTGTGGESGFEVVLRENPFGADRPDATPVIALCQDPLPGEESRLSRIIRRLSEGEGHPTSEVCREWFRRYLDVSLRPLLWLYFTHGVAVEAHQQNSVVVLEDGYPARFYYRDNQGYYFEEEQSRDLERLLPGIHGIEDDTVVPREVADERLRYYFFINNLFGLVNAFGVAGLADERALLAELRSVLEELEDSAPGSSRLIPSLLHDEKLPGKANLLTRLHDMDELVGDLETQSVYVEIENPLAGSPDL